MNYIENIYVCLAAPILIALLLMRPVRRRTMLFFLGGMTVCLLSSYISTFLAAVNGADLEIATIEIAPMVEEVMKLMPILFFLLVFEPKKEEAGGSALLIAVGFATFENVCYLIQNGAENIVLLLIRGFGTGAMHVVCGLSVASGLLYLWDRLWLRVAGTAGLLIFAIAYHAIFNLLVAQTGAAAQIGYLIPMVSAFLWVHFRGRLYRLPTAPPRS